MNEFFNTGLGKTLLIIGIVFLAITTLGQLRGLRYIGAGVQATNTINVSGYGEAFGAADIATFSFSVSATKPTVTDAQADATAKVNAITKYLTDSGIDKKDIQTTDYSVYPEYEYQSVACPQVSGSAAVYCPPGRQVLKGYTVRQTTSVKVRDTAKAGDLLAGVGSKGATEVSGLQFTFDDPNKLQNDARGKAIADAKAKADELAKELGVSLVRVVSFSENSSGYNPRVYALDAASKGASTAAVAPEISVGQNKVTSNVSITYEIR
jgi:uncharacterized protein YggE